MTIIHQNVDIQFLVPAPALPPTDILMSESKGLKFIVLSTRFLIF